MSRFGEQTSQMGRGPAPRPSPRGRPHRPPPAQSRKKQALGAVAALAAIWVVSGLALRVVHSGRVLPGTSVAGLDLGGIKRDAASTKLAAEPPAVVTLESGSRDFRISAPRAGLDADLERTVERAISAGRNGAAGLILGGPSILWSKRETAPAYQKLDRERLRNAVAAVADRVDQEPFPGALVINPKTLNVRPKQPEAGRSVDRGRAEKALLDAFLQGEGSVPLPVEARAAPGLADVREVALEAERYLSQPLLIDTAGGPARFAPGKFAAVLAVEPVPGTGEPAAVRLGVDPGKLEKLIGSFAAKRNVAPRDASLKAPAAAVLVTDQGDFSWRQRDVGAAVRPSRDGRQIRLGDAIDAVAEAVRAGEHRVRLPSEPVIPAVTTDQVRAADELIGTFTTSYSCCEPRVTNIQLIAKAADGTVIAPGAQFSLNGVAGRRTRKKGYLPAPFIADGKLVDSIGGGVSQFSTTIYNAAFFAGVQLDSHQPHSFYIDRYPAGREATLNFPDIDLTWTNDTGHPILVRTSASDTSVTVSLYGNNGGRKSSAVSDPRQKVEGGDFAITVTRVVRRPSGEIEREPFTTTYDNPPD